MRPSGHGWRPVGLPLLLAGSIAGCSAAPRESGSGKPTRALVVLSVETGPASRPGPIEGRLRCEDEGMPPVAPCLAEDITLAGAVLACGPVEATIDRGWSHKLLVKFPSGLSRRFPGMPADLDIVRCVQSRVGFGFSAGIAAGADGAPVGDPRPFQSLHSRRRGPGEAR